jgi:8-oxo-dGTP diphosphatase
MKEGGKMPGRIRVTAAVIEMEGKILLAQRGTGDRLAGKWEFPGGKIEDGETPEECLSREILEELGIVVQVEDFLCSGCFDYDHASVEIFAYRCRWISGQLRKNAHQALQWVLAEDFDGIDLAAADRPIAGCLCGKTDR